MSLTKENALLGHTDEASAYLVDDYPYGFRLRTSIRYWIETTKHGDRLCSQTLNPKTDRWNKPKKSTYVAIGCMFTDDETGHVTWAGVSHYTDDDVLAAFLDVMREHLNDSQKDRLAEIVGGKRGMAGVTYVVTEGVMTAEERDEQSRIEAVLRHRIARETGRARNELEAGQ